MTARTRVTWLVTGVTAVGLALFATFFVVPTLGGSDAEKTVTKRVQSQHATEYWTEKRMREAEPAGPLAVEPVPYGRWAAGAGGLIVVGGTVGWLLWRRRA